MDKEICLFANGLKYLRLKAGLSRKRLAEKAGITERTVQNIEEGRKPSLRTLEKLAEALQVPVKFLV